jgi:hypothetical protein
MWKPQRRVGPVGWAHLSLLLLLPLAAASAWAERAEAPTRVRAEHVQEALGAAGANRPALERVLAQLAVRGDPERIEAARFLIAHMPGKGHIVTALKDEKGTLIPYDPLAYPDFEHALQAYEALEQKHGKIDFARDHLVSDLETLTTEFLVEHIEGAFAAWQSAPPARRVTFEVFLEHILPYRGSEEPAEPWMRAMRERFGEAPAGVVDLADPEEVWRFANQDVGSRLGFNERYYLHPTDQGFAEMSRTKQGRCEDITNMTTYAARALGLATAADYTPAWGHRDNNHAWNVLLDAHGVGADRAQAHAAKVYRKTFSLQRDSLAFQLPEGREAPNRFLGSKAYRDVTDQYAPTTDVEVLVDPNAVEGEGFAYLCVFNGGEWTAIHWAPLQPAHEVVQARFTKMGRGAAGMLYLPAVHDGKVLRGAAPPLILHKGGRREALPGTGAPTKLLANAVSPPQKSADTHVETPTMFLAEGTTYVLQCWTASGWETVQEVVAGKEPLVFEALASDGLYWMTAKDSRRLERPFTIEGGRQRWW